MHDFYVKLVLVQYTGLFDKKNSKKFDNFRGEFYVIDF